MQQADMENTAEARMLNWIQGSGVPSASKMPLWPWQSAAFWKKEKGSSKELLAPFP